MSHNDLVISSDGLMVARDCIMSIMGLHDDSNTYCVCVMNKISSAAKQTNKRTHLFYSEFTLHWTGVCPRPHWTDDKNIAACQHSIINPHNVQQWAN